MDLQIKYQIVILWILWPGLYLSELTKDALLL
jgi:hypothetical protein